MVSIFFSFAEQYTLPHHVIKSIKILTDCTIILSGTCTLFSWSAIMRTTTRLMVLVADWYFYVFGLDDHFLIWHCNLLCVVSLLYTYRHIYQLKSTHINNLDKKTPIKIVWYIPMKWKIMYWHCDKIAAAISKKNQPLPNSFAKKVFLSLPCFSFLLSSFMIRW